MNANFVELGERGYPKLLEQIKDPPKKLYYKGEWNERLFEKCLAVVGSRRMTSYGERCVRPLVYDVAAAGGTVVSGFMYGIDASAHRAALDTPAAGRASSRTVAVMPCGIDLIIPEYQAGLYNKIISSGGLVISEFEADFPPSPWTFPKRNRIVAGLCQAVLVVEAGFGSGSLITAEFAKNFGRKVFAVPGNIDSKLSQGTLSLIEDGATMVTSSKKILEFYKVESAGSIRGNVLGRSDGRSIGNKLL